MATLRINRAKKLIASGLNDKLNYMALYQDQHPIEVGQEIVLYRVAGKSDGSPFYVNLNKVEDLDKYKTINNFSLISNDGSNIIGLNRIMNFFIDHRNSVSKIVISDGYSGGNVTAVVHIPTITPTNGEDENFLINVFEILID